MTGMVKVMFLGGPLDHTVREVEAEPHNPVLPKSETYTVIPPAGRAPWVVDHVLPPEPRGEVFEYRLEQIVVGDRSWWVYILRGYNPPRSHILDTCPVLSY